MNTVLVTGATRGLGLAIAQRLVETGFEVIATGRTETDEVRALQQAHSDRFRFERFDLAEVDGLQAFVRDLSKANGPLFALVNNAAIGTDGVLGTMHNRDIEQVLRINVLAPMVLTKYVVRTMMAAGRGRIVNISSIIASTGFSGLTVYGGSKAAMEGFTKS